MGERDRLAVTEWRTGSRPAEHDGRLRLESERRWVVAGELADLEVLAGALPPSFYTRVGPQALVLDLVNSVGTLDLPFLGSVELVSGKSDEREFERMLAELTEVATGLPFSARDAAAFPYDRSVAAREDVLYHAFVYLRRVLSPDAPREQQLVPALNVILREPHRVWRVDRHVVPIETLTRIDSLTLLDLVTRTGTAVHADTLSPSGAALASKLMGRLPEEVSERRIRSTFDNAENRFVKAFIGQAGAIIERTRSEVARSGKDAFRTKILHDCDRMERALRPITRASLWEEVGPLVHVPLSSTVLQRRRGYRDVFRHFSKMRLATRIPLDKRHVRDLLELKDIALLYELWTFFRLVAVLQDLVGPPARAGRPTVGALEVSVKRDLFVEWSSGLRVTYNPPFSRSRPRRRRSYSVPLRPDIALRIPDGPNAGLHLFDAKFRVQKLADVSFDATEDESAEEEAEERRGTFKRGDVYKMHTYRDAIPEARSVWVLYPGSEFRFFDASGSRAISQIVNELPAFLNGVGAIPVSPESEGTALRAILGGLSRLGLGSHMPGDSWAGGRRR